MNDKMISVEKLKQGVLAIFALRKKPNYDQILKLIDSLAQPVKTEAIEEVIIERKRQDEKWGEQNHDPAKWLAILGEEFGEVCKAVCERLYAAGSNSEYRIELIHVAAVAVAMAECYDRAELAEIRRRVNERQ
jgi:hypothetical protein